MIVKYTPEFEEDVRKLFSGHPKYRLLRFWGWISHGLWQSLRFKWQRASRGYSEGDVWSLDSYLNSWLPSALRELKSDNPRMMGGTPGMFKTRKQWDSALEKMALGFEASERIHRDLIAPDSPNFDKLKKQRDTGLKLFIKYYENLWD